MKDLRPIAPKSGSRASGSKPKPTRPPSSSSSPSPSGSKPKATRPPSSSSSPSPPSSGSKPKATRPPSSSSSPSPSSSSSSGSKPKPKATHHPSSSRSNPADRAPQTPSRRYDVEWLDDGEHNPKGGLVDAVREFGPPSHIDERSGGFAVWTRRDLNRRKKPYSRVEIRDEMIPHTEPTPHHVFYTFVIDYEIPEDRLGDVLNLSKALMYDRLKKQLHARCHSSGSIKATLDLALRIADGDITLDTVRREGLLTSGPAPAKAAAAEMEARISNKVIYYRDMVASNADLLAQYGNRPCNDLMSGGGINIASLWTRVRKPFANSRKNLVLSTGKPQSGGGSSVDPGWF